MRNERRVITTDLRYIKRIMKKYEWVYARKFSNSDKMDQFLEDTVFQNLHKEKHNRNRTITY